MPFAISIGTAFMAVDASWHANQNTAQGLLIPMVLVSVAALVHHLQDDHACSCLHDCFAGLSGALCTLWAVMTMIDDW